MPSKLSKDGLLRCLEGLAGMATHFLRDKSCLVRLRAKSLSDTAWISALLLMTAQQKQDGSISLTLLCLLNLRAILMHAHSEYTTAPPANITCIPMVNWKVTLLNGTVVPYNWCSIYDRPIRTTLCTLLYLDTNILMNIWILHLPSPGAILVGLLIGRFNNSHNTAFAYALYAVFLVYKAQPTAI